jgi:hypothetical protein
MKRTVVAFAVATLIYAGTYGQSGAAPVYAHYYRHSHQYVIVPLTSLFGYPYQNYYWRRDYLPYWAPQGFYQSPFGPERRLY